MFKTLFFILLMSGSSVLWAQRTVSLAPNLTETLFALGLGEKVVGVTDYCLFPPEAQTKTSVGGYLDPSLERIVGLQPDLVVCLPEHQTIRIQLEQLGLKVLEIQNYSLADLYNMISQLGSVFQVQAEATALSEKIQSDLAAVKCERDPKLRVLAIVGRDYGMGIRELYCVGSKGFMNEILEWTGMQSAVESQANFFPQVGAEGVVQMDPDIILDLVMGNGEWDSAKIKADWQQLQNLRAVQEQHVYVLADPMIFVPGPRVASSVKRLLDVVGCPE
ncbi:MAG: ABC transporter substrate-binding protein [Acidobacteria bacterium]|nr:ABC transporter substrate-binding protein [Acidobacteriota bacterium]MCB9396373.1 ABC transporter substrate-binding protein [Acidobacteriota bacterium]